MPHEQEKPMQTIQDREEINGNRYIVTPLAHIHGYRIDIMMAEYFDTLGLTPNRFLQETDKLHGDLAQNSLERSPFMLHWIRIIDTDNARSYCLNRLEAQAFGLLFGLCNFDGGNDDLLRDIITQALALGSFCKLVTLQGPRIASMSASQYWTGRNIGDIKLVDRPTYQLGIASFACIPQPAIRHARADYCILAGMDYTRFTLEWNNLPALHPKDWQLQPTADRYFWLRYIDCSTGIAYCLSGMEADAFIIFRHRHCWGRSIHCLFDMEILFKPGWVDSPDNFEFKTCLNKGSFVRHLADKAFENNELD